MTQLTFDEYVLEIKAISPLAPQALESNYKKQHPEPVRPTYQVEAVAGVVEIFPHTKDTVETSEEKEAFLKWEEEHTKWQTELMQRIIRMFLIKGVYLKLTPEQEEQLAFETELLGFDVPKNKLERELFYLETFVISTQQRLETVMKAVLSETGVNQEVLQQAEKLF